MKVAIYARISRVTEATTSVDRQVEHCRAFAAQRGWAVVDIYTDEGVSGALDPERRPAMGELLNRLGDYDAIVFYRLDRIARSVVGTHDLLKRAEAAKVAMVSVTEPFDTSSAIGRAMVTMTATFAELERGMIKERAADARRKLLADGKFVGGRFPYGLTPAPHPSGKGRVLVRDPEAVKIIRQMATWLVDERCSTTEIAKRLNAAGVPTSRMRGATAKAEAEPTSWRGNAVRQILRNQVQRGYLVDRRGDVERGDDGAPIVQWAPVLNDAEWTDVQHRLDELASGPRAVRHDSFWLTPVTRCAVCRYRLTQTRAHGRYGLKCARPNEQRHRPAPFIRRDELAAWVDTEVIRLLGNAEVIERVWVPGSDVTAELADVRAAIARLRDDRDAGLYSGEEDAAEYRERLARLIRRRDTLAAIPVVEPHWETRATGQRFGDVWATADGTRKRELLDQMGLRVWVAPGNRSRNQPVGERAWIAPEDEAMAEVPTDAE